MRDEKCMLRVMRRVKTLATRRKRKLAALLCPGNFLL